MSYLFDRPPPLTKFEVTRLWCEEHHDPCCVQDHEPVPGSPMDLTL